MTWENLRKIDRASLKKIIRDYDNDYWHKGLNDKSVLRFYSTEKKAIGYDFCYRNSYNSKLYARARTNALQLEEHKGMWGRKRRYSTLHSKM